METELTDIPPFPKVGERDYTLFRTLIRTTGDGVIVTDEDGIVQIYNDASARLFQHAPEEILGQTVKALFSAPYHDEFGNCIRQIAATSHDKAIERELQALRKDGSVFPVQISLGKGWLDGAPVYLAVVHDLTALYRERTALDEEKAYLAQITESSNDAIVSYMLDGTVRTWNRAAEEMFGYRTDEIVGGKARSLATMFIPRELIPAETEYFRRAIAGEKMSPHESVRLHKDGTPVQVLVSASPIRDANGTVVGIARTLRDIRERKAFEKERALLSLAIESSDDACICIGLDGTTLSWNRRAEQMLGYSAAETIGTHASEMIPRVNPPELVAIELENNRRATAGEKIGPYETVRIHKDGRRIEVLCTLTPVRNERGEILAVFRVLRDISQRKAYERQRALLSAIVASSGEGIISIDLEGKVTSWNHAAEAMYGWTAEEMMGTDFHTAVSRVVDPERVAEEEKILGRVIAGERVPPFEIVRRRKDGSPLYAQISVSPIRDDSGAIIGVSRITHDRGERRAYEEQRALLSAVVNSSSDAIISYDLNGDITSFNRAAEAMYGYRAEDVIGMNVLHTVSLVGTSEHIAEESEILKRLLAGETIPPYERLRKRKDGSPLHALVSLSTIRDATGKVIGTSRIVRDVGDRKAFEEQRALLSAIVDSSSEAIISYGLNGAITSWNRAAEEMYGSSAEEMIGKTFIDAVSPFATPEQIAEEKDILAKLIAGETVGPYERLRKRKDGRPLHALISVSTVRDTTGRIIGTSKIVRDLGERKAFEQQRALMSAIVDSSNDAIISCDVNGTVTSWNKAAEAMYGFSAQEMVDRKFSSAAMLFVSQEQLAEEEGFNARAVRGERIPPYEAVRTRKDGSILHVQVSLAPIFDASGVIVGSSRTIRDISERKALEQQRALLSAIVESSNDAVYTKTLEGVVTSWNAAAEAMFGYKAEEITGKSMMVLVPPDRANEEHDAIRRILNGETIRHYETIRLRRDGSPFDVSVTTSPLRAANGAIIGASKTIRDITERKAYEAHLQALREDLIHVARVNELSQVSAGIAHELNQPLAAMLNYSNTAKRLVAVGGAGAYEKLPTIIGKVGEQAERASQIIRRMRDFVEKRTPHRSIEDINSIADDAVAIALIGSKAANINTHFIHEPNAAPVSADRVQIQQVLVNLLRNAAEAMADTPRRELTLSISKASDTLLQISVADTGTGIPDSVAARLFTPFVTTKDNGMGIGLAISKSIIEAHGGELTMQSNPGGGTIFHFTLPVVTGEPVTPAQRD